MDRDSKNKGPAVESPAYERMEPRWKLIDTLLGGTESMRLAGQDYLPRHPEESEKRYKERLQTNVLLNMTELTLDTLTGKPFSEPINLNDDIPPPVQEILDDVDLLGHNLDVFCRQWFRSALAKAFCHVLVDYPRLTPRADGQPRTLADDRVEGVRPYWVLIQPENVIYAYSEVVNGREMLTHVRIRETISVMGEWEEQFEEQIKVLTPGHVAIYKKRGGSGPKKDEWVLEDEWDTGLSQIPLVTFYADRTGLMEGKPPLLDLAYMNIAHWQSSSDQRSVLTVARFPILAASGLDPNDAQNKIVVGPYQLLVSPDAQGKFYYVEHTGSAIESGAKDLQSLEDSMASYGSQFLVKKPGNQTATARALDTAESSSDLQAMTVSFEDSIATALSFTAEWMRLGTEGGTVELEKDYGLDDAGAPGLSILDAARQRKEISRKAYIAELKRNGVLDEEFDFEADQIELEEEAMNGLTFGATTNNLDPAQNSDTSRAIDPAASDTKLQQGGPSPAGSPSPAPGK